MTQSERLKELLIDADKYAEKICTDYDEAQSVCADYLIGKGVIAPPAKIGDTIYVIPSRTNYNLNLFHGLQKNNRVYKQPIDHIAIWKDDYMLRRLAGGMR